MNIFSFSTFGIFFESVVAYCKKNKFFAVVFLMYCVATFLIFASYFPIHYSNDDYYIKYNHLNYAAQASSQGRPITSLIAMGIEYLDLNLVNHQQLFLIVAIVLYACGLSVLYFIFLPKDASRNYKTILFFVIFFATFNFMTVDMMAFSFMNIQFSLAYLFAILALYFYVSDRTIFQKVILALIFLIFSILIYQAWISIFLIFGLIYYLSPKNGKNSNVHNLRYDFLKKDSNKLLTGLFFIYGTASFVDFIWIKYLHTVSYFGPMWTDGRTGNIDVIDNLYVVLDRYWFLIVSSNNLIFPYAYLGVLLGTLGALFLLKRKLSIWLVFLTFFIIFISAVPHIFSGTPIISPRSMIVVFSIPILLLLFTIRNSFYNLNKNSNKLYLLSVVVVLFFIMSTFYTFIKYGTELHVTYKLDKMIALSVYGKILEYEKETKNEITEIYFVDDENPLDCYKSLVSCGEGTIDTKAYATLWSQIFPINMVSGRNYEIRDENLPEYKLLFKGKNWDYFSEGQFKFLDNKMIIAVF